MQTIIEPFKIKSVEPIHFTTREERIMILENAFYNPFFIHAEDVLIDLKAMGEDEVLKKCVLGLKLCSKSKPCPIHAEYKLIKPQLIKMFEMRTIQDLANDIDNGDVFISNKDK